MARLALLTGAKKSSRAFLGFFVMAGFALYFFMFFAKFVAGKVVLEPVFALIPHDHMETVPFMVRVTALAGFSFYLPVGVETFVIFYSFVDIFVAVEAFFPVYSAPEIVAFNALGDGVEFVVGFGQIAGRDQPPESKADILGEGRRRDKNYGQRYQPNKLYEQIDFPESDTIKSQNV